MVVATNSNIKKLWKDGALENTEGSDVGVVVFSAWVGDAEGSRVGNTEGGYVVGATVATATVTAST